MKLQTIVLGLIGCIFFSFTTPNKDIDKTLELAGRTMDEIVSTKDVIDEQINSPCIRVNASLMELVKIDFGGCFGMNPSNVEKRQVQKTIRKILNNPENFETYLSTQKEVVFKALDNHAQTLLAKIAAKKEVLQTSLDNAKDITIQAYHNLNELAKNTKISDARFDRLYAIAESAILDARATKEAALKAAFELGQEEQDLASIIAFAKNALI